MNPATPPLSAGESTLYLSYRKSGAIYTHMDGPSTESQSTVNMLGALRYPPAPGHLEISLTPEGILDISLTQEERAAASEGSPSVAECAQDDRSHVSRERRREHAL